MRMTPNSISLYPYWITERQWKTLNLCLENVMSWMIANKLKRNPEKMKVLLVWSSLVLGSECAMRLDGFALTSKASVCSLFVLLDLGLFLDVPVSALASFAYYQLWLFHQLLHVLNKKDLAAVTHTLDNPISHLVQIGGGDQGKSISLGDTQVLRFPPERCSPRPQH